jgi:hypothetical protein
MPAPTSTEVFGPGFVANTTANTITFQYADNADPVHDFVMINDDEVVNVADARVIIYAILARFMAWQTATPTLDRPDTIRGTSGGSVVTANNVTFIQRNFNIVFQADLTALQLLPEA